MDKIIRIPISDKNIFNATKRHLIYNNSNFVQEISGSTHIIYYKNKKYIYSDVGDNKNKGFHLSISVNKDVENYIINNENKIPKSDSNYKEQMFNISAIENNINIPLVLIDIDNCYWQTIYKLGYITQKTYLLGLKKNHWKMGRNTSIGSLSKRRYLTTYEGSKITKNTIESNENKKKIRNHVVGSVYNIFNNIYNDLGDNFFMFLTDCVVTSPNKIKEIKKIINGNGYECKQKSVIFTKIDKQNKIIYWHDFDEINKKTLAKGVDKYYHYSENQVINNK